MTAYLEAFHPDSEPQKRTFREAFADWFIDREAEQLANDAFNRQYKQLFSPGALLNQIYVVDSVSHQFNLAVLARTIVLVNHAENDEARYRIQFANTPDAYPEDAPKPLSNRANGYSVQTDGVADMKFLFGQDYNDTKVKAEVFVRALTKLLWKIDPITYGQSSQDVVSRQVHFGDGVTVNPPHSQHPYTEYLFPCGRDILKMKVVSKRTGTEAESVSLREEGTLVTFSYIVRDNDKKLWYRFVQPTAEAFIKTISDESIAADISVLDHFAATREHVIRRRTGRVLTDWDVERIIRLYYPAEPRTDTDSPAPLYEISDFEFVTPAAGEDGVATDSYVSLNIEESQEAFSARYTRAKEPLLKEVRGSLSPIGLISRIEMVDPNAHARTHTVSIPLNPNITSSDIDTVLEELSAKNAEVFADIAVNNDGTYITSADGNHQNILVVDIVEKDAGHAVRKTRRSDALELAALQHIFDAIGESDALHPIIIRGDKDHPHTIYNAELRAPASVKLRENGRRRPPVISYPFDRADSKRAIDELFPIQQIFEAHTHDIESNASFELTATIVLDTEPIEFTFSFTHSTKSDGSPTILICCWENGNAVAEHTRKTMDSLKDMLRDVPFEPHAAEI